MYVLNGILQNIPQVKMNGSGLIIITIVIIIIINISSFSPTGKSGMHPSYYPTVKPSHA